MCPETFNQLCVRLITLHELGMTHYFSTIYPYITLISGLRNHSFMAPVESSYFKSCLQASAFSAHFLAYLRNIKALLRL